MQRLKQWAPCYRASTTVNTNMALESFHRVLKVCYLQKKQNRRIDYLLHILLKISRDKVFDRLQKSQKGKISHRICEINKRHRTAQSMNPANCIISRNETSWRIKPESSTQQEYYTVEKVSNNSCSCKVRCNRCDICICSYSCTCMDYLIHATICKHIHLVNIFDREQENETESSEINSSTTTTSVAMLPDCNESTSIEHIKLGSASTISSTSVTLESFSSVDVSSLQYLTHQISNQQNSDDLLLVREHAIETCKKIELAICNSESVDAIKACRQHLNNALTIMSSVDKRKHSVLPQKRKIAPNAHIQPQLRFISTKKKQQKKPRLAKPSNDEIAKCIETLDDVEIEVCGICFRENDNSYCSTVDWIQCSECDMWFHCSCVASDNENIDDIYICPTCNKEV